ncbi:MAG: 1-acyl-sn-glycerol-3-phosphate acyltransferase [Crocinitomicaceae bacterium]|nr:1-acyl-sn-glycerol-3-phosphate acyltransferase [Crocinitomicaceae bacterium]
MQNVRPEKPLIVCANHSSYLDIPMIHSVFREQSFLILGKAELTKWPLLRMFFKTMHIPVNRESSRESVRSLVRAREAFQDGWNIVIFPEGTIPTHVPKMKAFKNGAFEMAIRERADILPITFLDNWHRLTEPDNNRTQSLPGIARVVIHEIIPIEEYTKDDVVKLKNKVFETIEGPMVEYGVLSNSKSSEQEQED